MSITNKKKLFCGRIAVILLLIFTGVTTFMRSYMREPSADELLYQFVWEKDDTVNLFMENHRYERKVASPEDIISSQVIHYKKLNGRSLVHAAEQAFTGHELAFSVINALIFLLLVTLIVIYTTKNIRQSSYMLWLLTILSLLYLFPFQESLWISINYAPNYLWPSAMTIACLILWEKIIRGTLGNRWIIPAAILAFITGWSHEAFSVPIAGATFIYYCFRRKEFHGQALIFSLSLWVGTAIMVFAPSNIDRFFGNRPNDREALSFAGRIIAWVYSCMDLNILLILVSGVIVLLLCRRRKLISAFIRSNIPLVLTFALSFLFMVIIGCPTYAFTMQELIALIIIFRFCHGLNISGWKIPRLVLAVLLTLLFAVHYIFVVRDTIRYYRYYHDIVEKYASTDEYLFPTDTVSSSPLTAPYIRIWNEKHLNYTRAITDVYGSNKCPLTMLPAADTKGVANPDSLFTDKNKFPGSAPVYRMPGGKYLWVNTAELPAGAKMHTVFYPVDWSHNTVILPVRIKFALFPDKYENFEETVLDSIPTAYGEAVFLKPHNVRKIKAVDIIQ